jgi:hypothetical protein
VRHIPGWRAQISRKTIIIGAVVVAVVGAAAGAWQTSHHPAALARATCGSASAHFVTSQTRLLRAAPGALTCFVRAARDCRPASLRVTGMGVDTGTDYVFIIEPGTGPCQVAEQSQGYSANFGGSKGPVSIVACIRTAVTRNGVALNCGGRGVLIPAKVSVTSPRPA